MIERNPFVRCEPVSTMMRARTTSFVTAELQNVRSREFLGCLSAEKRVTCLPDNGVAGQDDNESPRAQRFRPTNNANGIRKGEHSVSAEGMGSSLWTTYMCSFSTKLGCVVTLKRLVSCRDSGLQCRCWIVRLCLCYCVVWWSHLPCGFVVTFSALHRGTWESMKVVLLDTSGCCVFL